MGGDLYEWGGVFGGDPTFYWESPGSLGEFIVVLLGISKGDLT